MFKKFASSLLKLSAKQSKLPAVLISRNLLHQRNFLFSTEAVCPSLNAQINEIISEGLHQGGKDFYVEQFFTSCLAEYAYYIESNGEAAIIDPLTDTDSYVQLANKRGAKIKYIFETHFHADFVSGHVPLSKKTGAQIVFGPTAKANFPIIEAKDGEIFNIGKIKIKVLHTPGHTMESSCFALLDEDNQVHSVYTGDTLFLGEVGRPDLAVSATITSKDLAGFLYESLKNKIMPLPDKTIVFPGHGAGSPCGKNIAAGNISTIAIQKATNYGLATRTKDEFISIMTANLPEPLPYFFHDVGLNKGLGTIENYDENIAKSHRSISAKEVSSILQKDPNVLLLDIREDILDGFIKQSLHVSLKTSFAIWVGTLVNPNTKIILVAKDAEQAREGIVRLARVGFNDVLGYLEGGVKGWKDAGFELKAKRYISAEDFVKKVNSSEKLNILDIRNKGEWEGGVIDGAKLLSLRDLHKTLNNDKNALERKQTVYMHCKTGVRGSIGYSIVAQFGYDNVINVLGGIDAMIPHGIKTVTPNF